MRTDCAHRAVCAGLGGASLAFMPQAALALSLDGLGDQLLSLPFAPFAAGMLGGAVVAGGVYAAVVKIAELSDGPHPKKTSKPARVPRAAHAEAAVPVAASKYKPRHMSPDDFEKSGVIRVQPAQQLGRHSKENMVSSKHLKPSIIDRLDKSMMNGVPIIERADGTVGDLGTSWWTRTVGEQSIVSNVGFSAERPVDAFLYDKNRVATQAITHRVAQIDEGLYPEMRTSDDLDRSDMWTSALEALDDALGEPRKEPFAQAGILDVIGGNDTIDEPDGLEANTGFIPFRVPAGHPEVTDTESYINHVLSDEFSRSTSDAARTSSRQYLRVIEGGTHGMRKLGQPRHQKPVYVGKHFAQPELQAQAL